MKVLKALAVLEVVAVCTEGAAVVLPLPLGLALATRFLPWVALLRQESRDLAGSFTFTSREAGFFIAGAAYPLGVCLQPQWDPKRRGVGLFNFNFPINYNI